MARCRSPLVAFLLLSFVVAPALCFLLGLCFGSILAAVEEWTLGQGFWYVVNNMAGTPPLGNATATSTVGVTVDVAVSTVSLVFASTVVGVSGMLAWVGDLPDRLALTTVPRGLLAMVLVIPLCVVVCCALFGLVIAGAEGVDFVTAFTYTVSTVCGLGNPLTDWAPATTHGAVIVAVVGVAAQGLIGVIIGIAGGIAPLVAAVDQFDRAFDPDAVQEVQQEATSVVPPGP